MPNIRKGRRTVRPKVLANRLQRVKNDLFKKKPLKHLYENIQARNHALAKALSNEKKLATDLFSDNIALTSQVQELSVACNLRDDVISNVLKNAKCSLELLVTMSSHLTETIALCQKVVNSSKLTPRKTSDAPDSRKSMQRMSMKSPARGVVQPMVSGHTITKPTINLSRLNIQRKRIVTIAPAVSDIEESLSSPEQSPSTSSPANAAAIAKSPNFQENRRTHRRPELRRSSMRSSNENERPSSSRASRKSGRHSFNHMRRSSGVSRRSGQSLLPEARYDERLCSPRVALHDVSRLLQNSQTVNIRTLAENSSFELEASEIQVSHDVETQLNESATKYQPEDRQSEEVPSSRCFIESKNESRVQLETYDDDPLEGPSWLLNDCQVTLPVDNVVSTTTLVPDGPNKIVKENGKSFQSILVDRKIDDPWKSENDSGENVSEDTMNGSFVHQYENNREENRNDEMDTDLPMFVTKKRGSYGDQTDDFTLLWKKPKNYNFDINDLELPDLEMPIVRQPEVRLPEAEPTELISISTQNLTNLTSLRPHSLAGICDDSPIIDASTLGNDNETMLPPFPDNPDSTSVSIIEQEEKSSDVNSIVGRLRKRHPEQRKYFSGFTSSDCDSPSSPKRRNTSEKRTKKNGRDPTMAKVVLQKLTDSEPSNLNRSNRSLDNDNSRTSGRNEEHLSDAEGSSNASSITSACESDRMPVRSKRRKAPKSLKEPSLMRKLRRN